MNDSRRLVLRGALLALAAAYVDTCGFIGLFGLFTAHVTGNFVLIGADVVNRHVDILTKSLALPVFIASVVLTNLAEVAMRRRAMAAATWLLGVEGLLIAAAALAPRWTGLPGQPDDAASVAIGFLLIVAIGVQNALMRTSLAGPVQTTVMTGNVTQLTIDLLALATGRADAGARTRIAAMWPVVAAFAVGSALGAAGYAWLRFDCLWLASVLVGGAAWLVRREDAAKGSAARSAI
ncbi:YoaK family protein [Roseateles sp. BYS78W]|uniref:YoaK family protein n=1 Tax=Pelomonas candidula TaxID=3299025 RepID=A0ABW7HH66_9BURK